MKKRVYLFLLGIFSISLLNGCCKEHQWVEATCDAPKTCSECGKTEGEKLEHIWVDATCSAPKTCKLCGATEGESLPHTDGKEANYQSGPICSVCGQEIGEKLPSDFEEKEIPGTFLELNTPAKYVTACYSDPSIATVGTVTVTDYERFDSSEDFAEVEGYEWIKVSFELNFDDDASSENGFMIGPFECDYYTIDAYDSSEYFDDESSLNHFTVNYNGEDYEDCVNVWGDYESDAWQDDGDGTSSIRLTCSDYVLIPKGYDGIVYGFYNRQIGWGENSHIYDVANEDTLFFRCK